MLEIIEKQPGGTVLVQSITERFDPNPKNQFILDYEDYILLKDCHFYAHLNGSFITRRGIKQINLNRVLAEKRGFLNLDNYSKILVKHVDKDKKNFSKHNLFYYFTKDCSLFKEPQFLPRGVFFDGEYFRVAIPAMGKLFDYGKQFSHQYQAEVFYRKEIMLVKETYLEWI